MIGPDVSLATRRSTSLVPSRQPPRTALPCTTSETSSSPSAATSDSLSSSSRLRTPSEMESFALAETFKYYWLLFSPPSALDFDGVVFNTEAHPLRKTWKD